MVVCAGCTKAPASLEYQEESLPPVQELSEVEIPTVDPEMPTMMDEEIITQQDTSA